DVRGLDAALGDLLLIGDREGGLRAEVVAVSSDGVRAMPLDAMTGIAAGAPVRATGGAMRIPAGPGLLGRVVDATGRPI
ncbi:EscN/YscN/HrcN family type III secretion system ATPase, partial [Mesorhizobium japonicum]